MIYYKEDLSKFAFAFEDHLLDFGEQGYIYKYDNDNNPLHHLNIYLPKDNNETRPLLIDVHGGGWVYGDKDTNGLLCMDFVKRGFITMSMSYRLLPEHKLVEMIQDIFKSLHYLYTLKDKYPIDFENVSMMGDSAGGGFVLSFCLLKQPISNPFWNAAEIVFKSI